MKFLTNILLILVGLIAVSEQSCRLDLFPSFPIKAIAIVRGQVNNPVTSQMNQIRGSVVFEQLENEGEVRVTYNISGFARSGNHGFHVHVFGINSLADDFLTACLTSGGHYNPTLSVHGGSDTPIRHVGDLGNVIVDDSLVAVNSFTTRGVELCGPQSILGRTISVHVNADDLGTVGNGNTGPRIACGMIGYSN